MSSGNKKLFTQKEYINGCYTQYGTRPLNKLEMQFKAKLPNGMWCVGGIVPEDGISLDVYEDKALTKLVFMEHGITVGNMKELNWENISLLACVRLEEMGI